MDELANKLNRRYEVVTSKVGEEFILGLRDYFELVEQNKTL